MFKWGIIFGIIALIAGLLGFTNIAGASASVAKYLFAICLTAFVLLILVASFMGNKMS